ncbi:MAG: hypothetical protein ACLP7Q_20675 [Isosphaeraceae bacterium]
MSQDDTRGAIILTTESISHISFTPAGKGRVEFNPTGVRINSKPVEILGEGAVDGPGINIGPAFTRVTSLRIGSITTFHKGEVGTLQLTEGPTGLIYSLTNAKVIESKLDDLLVEAESLDGFTSPSCFAWRKK